MEQQNMQDRAGYYLETFSRVREQVQDEETARAILQEIGKDGRVEKMHESSNGRVGIGHSFRGSGNGGNNQGDQPATEKQLWLLRSLGMNPPEGLTKRSASELIDETRANGR